ncbi:RpiB/LacA/LacB family sugar-phosphate isomerase, partial [Murimonas intestini]
MKMKNIVIGCDNAGVEFKNEIISYLYKAGYQVEDVGVDHPDDYTYY